MGVVVGIDLGTTHTVVAAVIEGKAVALADEGCSPLIPSVISFLPSGAVWVGSAAMERRLSDPQNTISSVKRLLGRTWDTAEVQKARQRFSFELREGPGHATLVVAHGETYTLPELSAFVLRKAKSIAELVLGDSVERAVITVPANFNDLQRSATKVAARVAGLEVLRIINEPTAAALAFGAATRDGERVAVFDFGGGTFDITILTLVGGLYEVTATAGDTFLGGDDIDQSVAEELAQQIRGRYDFDVSGVSGGRELLRQAAETAKIRLSTELSTTVDLDTRALAQCPHPQLKVTLSRTDFERLALPWVNRTFDVCSQAFVSARLGPKEIDRVLLVGGSTQMPIVRQRVATFFGKSGQIHAHPTEIVARGAALHAAALVAKSEHEPLPVPPPPEPTRRPSTQPHGRPGTATSPGLGADGGLVHRPARVVPPLSTTDEPAPVTLDMGTPSALASGSLPERGSTLETPHQVAPVAEEVPFSAPVPHRERVDTLAFGESPPTLSGLGENRGALAGPRRTMVRVTAGTTDATDATAPSKTGTTLAPPFARTEESPTTRGAFPARAPRPGSPSTQRDLLSNLPMARGMAPSPASPAVGVGKAAPVVPDDHNPTIASGAEHPGQPHQEAPTVPPKRGAAPGTERVQPPIFRDSALAAALGATQPVALVHPPSAATEADSSSLLADVGLDDENEPTIVAARPNLLEPPVLHAGEVKPRPPAPNLLEPPVLHAGEVKPRPPALSAKLDETDLPVVAERPAARPTAVAAAPAGDGDFGEAPQSLSDAELRARYGNLPLIVGGKRVPAAHEQTAVLDATARGLLESRPDLPKSEPVESPLELDTLSTPPPPPPTKPIQPHRTLELERETDLPEAVAPRRAAPPIPTAPSVASPLAKGPLASPPASRFGSMRPSARHDPDTEAALPVPDVPRAAPPPRVTGPQPPPLPRGSFGPAPILPLGAPSGFGQPSAPPPALGSPSRLFATQPLGVQPAATSPLGPALGFSALTSGVALGQGSSRSVPPATYASPIIPLGGERQPLLIDVTPLSLCVETAGGFADVLVPRNTAIPCEKTREFVPAQDNQDTVRVRIAQGESQRFSDNVLLGEVELTHLRPQLRDQSRLAITFAIDSDGILHARAIDLGTGRAAEADLRLVGAPSAAEVAKMAARQSLRPFS